MASSLKFLRNRFFIAAALVMVLGALAAAVIFILAEVAEIKVAQVHALARKAGYPLKTGLEEV